MLPNFRRADEGAKPQTTAQPAEPPAAFPARPFLATPRAVERPATSVIGPDLTINGNLISKGEVHVDGIVEGDIHGSHVIVGPSATITGSIVADETIVRGHVVGSIRAKRVMLQASSQVEGDIYHQALSIEQGAMFEGKSRRSNDDPRAGTAAPNITMRAAPPDLPN